VEGVRRERGKVAVWRLKNRRGGRRWKGRTQPSFREYYSLRYDIFTETKNPKKSKSSGAWMESTLHEKPLPRVVNPQTHRAAL
jgi:hypothetical protein